MQLSTMTNGSSAITSSFLERAGLLKHFDKACLMEVAQPRAWKPAPAAYKYAADQLPCSPDQVDGVSLSIFRPSICKGELSQDI